ncbi:MAG TPA: hypothetical protein VL400_00820, partial [Polyangiaceae bacterium]|nr:hypothetical protein [Polyangiaceae bacterium]
MAILAASAVGGVIWWPHTTTLAEAPAAKPASSQRADAKSAQAASGTQGADDVASQSLCTRTRPREGGRPVAGATGQGSTLALSRWPDGSTIAYVAHADDRSLVAVDVDKKIVRGTTPLDGEPSSVLVLGDGRVVATIRDKSRIQVFEPTVTPTEPLRSLCRVTVAAEPVGLAVTPDDHTLLVTSAWGHELAAMDTRTFGVRLRAELPREPRAVVASDDGQRAFVAHVVDAKMSVVDLTSKTNNVRDISLAVNRDSQPMRGCQGFALAKSVDTVPKDGGEMSALRGALPPPARAANPAATAKPRPSDAAPAPSSSSASSASSAAPPPSDLPAPSTLAGRVFAPMVVVDVGTAGSPGYGNVERGPTETPFVSV